MEDATRHAGSKPQPARKARVKTRGQRMSDHVATALLVYTALLIFVTMKALEQGGGSTSLLPYFSLIVLVAAIIPACRKLEYRWLALDDAGTSDHREQSSRFTLDLLLLWLLAIGLPFGLTALAKLAFAV